MALHLLLVLAQIGIAVPAVRAEDLYMSQAIVTGTGERNRQPGFRDCLDRVLVRVSGDQRVIAKPAMTDLRARAGTFVRSFTYQDRLAGKPVHDEQGTYDRPHDLKCHYDRAVIDGLLEQLGSRPWLDPRPSLAIFLDVDRDGRKYRLDDTSERDRAMREAFMQAAVPMAMVVTFPTVKSDAPPEDLSSQPLGARRKHKLALFGTLIWSDPDLGWNATWHLSVEGQDHQWQVRGVNFDEAFRVAVRGAAQILSGNGGP